MAAIGLAVTVGHRSERPSAINSPADPRPFPSPIAEPRSAPTSAERLATAPPSPAEHAGPSRVETLRRDLASDSVATRIAAIEAVVTVTATDALPALEEVDLKRDPDAAPTIIHAVAMLGASA